MRYSLPREFEGADLHALRLARAVELPGNVLSARIEVRGVCGSCALKSDNKIFTATVRPRGRKGEAHA